MLNKLIILLFIVPSVSTLAQQDEGQINKDYSLSGLAMLTFRPQETHLSIGGAYYKFEGGNGSTYFGMRNIYATAGIAYRENDFYPSLSVGYAWSILFLDVGMTVQSTFFTDQSIDLLPHAGLTISGFATLYINYSLLQFNNVGIGLRVFISKWKT